MKVNAWRLTLLASVLSAGTLAVGQSPPPEDVQDLIKQLRRCRLDRVQSILERGTDPNAVLRLGPSFAQTAGSAACGTNCSAAAIRLLIAHGFDPNAVPGDVANMTPLFHCLAALDGEGSKALLEAGADLGRIDTEVLKIAGLGFSPAGRAPDPELHGRIEEELQRRGAHPVHQPEAPPGQASGPQVPPPEPGATYAPGTLVGGPCEHHGAIPANAACGDSGVEVFKATKIRTSGWDGTIHPASSCRPVELPPLPGTYTVWIVETTTEWALDKCYPSINVAFASKKSRTKESSYTFKAALPGADSQKPKTGTVRIVDPVDGDQFSFDAQPVGELSITVTAKMTGDNTTVDFEMDEIGGVKATVHPDPSAPKGTARATLRVRGLPKNNSDFGRVTIRAKGNAAGSDAVTVIVFFDPEATNHPGDGAGRTPNWFYYWKQTRAGQGYRIDYEPQRIDHRGTKAIGQYDYATDRVIVTDQIMREGCFARPKALGGKESTGIDCFAETVRHETQHQKERWEWWGSTNPQALPLHLKLIHDSDGDLVPNEVEDRLSAKRNCSKFFATSCDGRPDASLLDVEMNTYWIGWQWPVGSADSEDWSKCGKQWKDVSVCMGKRRW